MTNAFATPTQKEPTRRCNFCKEDKALSLLIPSKHSYLGRSQVCRACRSVQQKSERKRRADNLAQQTRAERAARSEDIRIVQPRTIASNKPWSPDTQTYVRNDGLKHIPSRGFPT